eukprot:TRINITY_DN76935_c0_g1_i1.p1 TRINITY_DN76935_c0_g1~~TRINITY_DN76935_c0_g1_i1.p1  ORF type:complete len:223 (-),score=25.78 TRINITY_DN76935_c0_g1_i1:34-702(-)
MALLGNIVGNSSSTSASRMSWICRNCDDVEWDGVSLHAARLARQAVNEERIMIIRASYTDDGWKLFAGDVFRGTHRWPYQVIRIRLGEYEREVRIARFGDTLSDYRAGCWVDTSNLFKLEDNDMLEAVNDFEDSPTDRKVMKHGSRWHFHGWDCDGDSLLWSGSHMVTTFREDLDNFTLISPLLEFGLGRVALCMCPPLGGALAPRATTANGWQCPGTPTFG